MTTPKYAPLSAVINAAATRATNGENEERLVYETLAAIDSSGGQVLLLGPSIADDSQFSCRLLRSILLSASANNVQELGICSRDTPESRGLPSFLNRSLSSQTVNIAKILLDGIPTVKANAEELLWTVLREKIHHTEMRLCLRHSQDDDSMMGNTFARYLQHHSSLVRLRLSFVCELSEQFVVSICQGIGASSSLQELTIHKCTLKHNNTFSAAAAAQESTDRVTKCLVDAMVNSSSLKTLVHVSPDAPGPFSFGRLLSLLHQTRAFRESQLTFTYKDLEDGRKEITFIRKCWWKEALALDIPLALWPQVLTMKNWLLDNNNDVKCGHSQMDVLHFFVKEKCDTLFQRARKMPRKKKPEKLAGVKRSRDF